MAGKKFTLRRDVDITGISGTGVVAHGIQWPDGTCAMRWCTDVPSTTIYTSIDDVIHIHGHEGKTRIVFDEDEEVKARKESLSVTSVHNPHATLNTPPNTVSYYTSTTLEELMHQNKPIAVIDVNFND